MDGFYSIVNKWNGTRVGGGAINGKTEDSGRG